MVSKGRSIMAFQERGHHMVSKGEGHHGEGLSAADSMLPTNKV